MKKARVSPRRTAVLVAAFIFCAVALGILVARRYQQSQMPPPLPIAQPLASTRIVTLFFATPDADGLVREGREIDACGDQAACIQAVMQELQNGPVGDFELILPEAAPVPTVSVTGDTAVLDLSRELVAELPDGSASELATVYALVDTIIVNFPQIRQVQLLVAGQKVQTLKGHIDIHEPLVQDLSHERKGVVEPAPGGNGAKP